MTTSGTIRTTMPSQRGACPYCGKQLSCERDAYGNVRGLTLLDAMDNQWHQWSCMKWGKGAKLARRYKREAEKMRREEEWEVARWAV